MPLNPDQVRVDILRIKRKLYISYPEGSKERQEFLLASKLSELSYLQKLISPDLMDNVFLEYHYRQRGEIINFFTCILGGACLSVMLLGFHQLHPANAWLQAFYVPAIVGFGYALTHAYHSLRHFNDMKPVKAEHEKISKKVERLLKEIGDLGKE